MKRLYVLMSLVWVMGCGGPAAEVEEPEPVEEKPVEVEAEVLETTPVQEETEETAPPVEEPVAETTVPVEEKVAEHVMPEIVWSKPFVAGKVKKLGTKWYSCKKDDQCVVMDTNCCEYISVNKTHEKKARKKFQHTMCDMLCNDYAKSVCIKGKCMTQHGESTAGSVI